MSKKLIISRKRAIEELNEIFYFAVDNDLIFIVNYLVAQGYSELDNESLADVYSEVMLLSDKFDELEVEGE